MHIAGKLLGHELLGSYSVAMHLASLPVQKLSSILNQVAFPAFAQSQHDKTLVSRYLLKSLRLLCFIAIPILWGISSIAPEIVDVILGPKWHTALVPLQLLPLVMPLTMISPFLNTAFQGTGHGAIVFRNVLTASLLLPCAFLIGVNWGLLGLSLAWVCGFPIVLAINLRRMLPLLGLRWSDVLANTLPAALTGCGMYGAVVLARYVAESIDAFPRMIVLILVGGVTYSLFALCVNRESTRELVQLLVPRKQPV